MFNSSRAFFRSALPSFQWGFLSGALLLMPLAARAQDAPDAPDATPAKSTAAWTTFKGDAQRTGMTMADVRLPLSLQWRYSSIGPARGYVTAPLVIGAPGNQRVVFAAGNVVYANDVNTGSLAWKTSELPSSITVPLALLSTDDGDLILALQTSGRLVALKTADGSRAWEADCGSLATEAGPMVVETAKGTRVICALNTGKMVAVDPNGKIDGDWRVQIGQVGTSAASSMALSRDGSRLFILGSDARLYIISVREARIVYSLSQAGRSGATPVAGADVVYTANARRVAAWRIGDGTASWTVTPSSDVIGSPALKPGENGGTTGATLFFGTRDGQFMAVDALNGKVNWQKTLVDKVSISGSPLVLPGAVVVGTASGTLVGFDPANGNIIWQYRLQTERVYDLKAARAATTGFGRGGQGRGGRGDFGGPGGFEGPGGEGTPNEAPQKRAYGVSSAPAAVDNRMFVLGDDAALYAFTSQPFDADPPRVVEPSISVNASDRRLLALLLSSDPDKQQIVPGTGPIYLATQIDDVGSGVDPDSIAVTVNDKPLEASRLFFGRGTGILTITLSNPAKGDPVLSDGLKKVGIVAKDYAGNTVNFSTNFLVDSNTPPPAAPVVETPEGQPEEGGRFNRRRNFDR